MAAQRVALDGLHAERFRQKCELHRITALARLIVDFLQADRVARELAQHIGHPRDVLPKVRTHAAVYVVRGDIQHVAKPIMQTSRPAAIAFLVLVMLLWGSTFVVTK